MQVEGLAGGTLASSSSRGDWVVYQGSKERVKGWFLVAALVTGGESHEVGGGSALAADSKFLSEFLDRVGEECAFQQPLKTGRVVHAFDFFADTFWNPAVADFQGAQH